MNIDNEPNKLYNSGDIILLKYQIENITLYKSIIIEKDIKNNNYYFLSNQEQIDIQNPFLVIKSYEAIEWHQYKYNNSIEKNKIYGILINGKLYYIEEKKLVFYENLFK